MEYLKEEAILSPTSIEEIFCQPLDNNGKRDPLSEMESKVLMMSITSTDEQIGEIYRELKEKYNLLSILEDRLEALNCKFDNRAIVSAGILCKTPGEAVMYANYIAYKCKKDELDIFDTKAFCASVFPMGKFSDDTLSEYWDKQKVRTRNGSDNLLDYIAAAESISK